MKHLTIDEIIGFVSIRKLDPESIDLMRHVNSHICDCKECLNRVKAFQTVYEEMTRMGNNGGSETSVYRALSDVAIAEKKKNIVDGFIELQDN